MLKKMDILGIQVDNYTVHEAMQKVEVYLNNTVMNRVETISTHMIEEAGKNETVKECIGDLDLAIIGETQILRAAGITSSQRLKETEEHTFFEEFMKRIIRNHKKVYLLSETPEQMEHLKDFLETSYERLQIVGTYVLMECTGDNDNIVNSINAEAPDIILSVIPSPVQEEFLMANRNKFGAKLWYGLGDNYRIKQGVHGIAGVILKRIRGLKLKRKIDVYNKM